MRKADFFGKRAAEYFDGSGLSSESFWPSGNADYGNGAGIATTTAANEGFC